MLRRIRRSRFEKIARLGRWTILALILAGLTSVAQAQPTAEGFALNRFEPSGGGSRWFTLESLDFRGNGRPAGALFFDWAHKPFVLYDRNDVEQLAIVERQIVGHAALSVNVFDRLRLGLTIPVVLNATGEAGSTGTVTYAPPDGTALGDLRLAADLLLFGRHDGFFRLAVGTFVYVPTGSQDDYAGEGSLRVAPRLMLAGDAGPLAWALRVGFAGRSTRDAATFQGLDLGHELTGAAAIGVRLGRRVLIGPEVFTASPVSGDSFLDGRATPAEVLLGAHVQVADDWQLGVGAGPGLNQGIGSPQWRAVARLEFFPAISDERDRDRDGVLDAEDACPDVPGMRTRDPRTTGCPPDRDGDGIPDTEDACPTEPGKRHADPKKHGCPPPADRDGDGISDDDDACPLEAGPANEDPLKHGCPLPADRDGDGIPDTEDACPEVPGKATNDPRTNGCADRDGDGVFDPVDACPEVAGPRTNDPRTTGCPPARVEKGQIRITEQVNFKTNSAVILPDSAAILTAVANILAEHSEITRVRIEGHTDNRGSARYNKGLSQRRAASVVRWLVRNGVDARRLTSEGFGLDRPIAPNDTEEGRRENRRVEFHIVDQPGAK